MSVAPVRLDDCLSHRDGVLFIEDVAAPSLVERFGSPLFVTSEDQLRRNVRRYRSSFAAAWPHGPSRILPAVKANWTLAAQRVMASEGCGADIYSEGELEIALRAGIDPRCISASGVPKSSEHIRRVALVGAKLTIDSLEDVRCLESMAPELPRPIRVRLRLRPAVSEFVAHSQFVHEGLVPSDVAALTYKSGLSFEEAVEAGRRALALPNVELVGFHQHHGRHAASLEWWRAQMRAYAGMMAEVSSALDGFRPMEIDIGGGFAIPRDPHNGATRYGAPVAFGFLHLVSRIAAAAGANLRYRAMRALVGTARTEPNVVAAPSIEAYAGAACGALAKALPTHGIDPRGVALEIEPGRGIFGDAGVHLTTVRTVKRQVHPLPWTIVAVDTSEFFLTAGRFERHLHQYLVATRVDAPRAMVADIVGRSCFADRLAPAVSMPQVAAGDILAFLDTGAYQEGSASNFNAMPRPATVVVTGDQAFVCRPAETLDAMLSRDLAPAHLTGAVAAEGAPA